MTLNTELQTIDGIGPATAEKIVAVVNDHGGPTVDPDRLAHARRQAKRGNEGEVIAFLDELAE